MANGNAMDGGDLVLNQLCQNDVSFVVIANLAINTICSGLERRPWSRMLLRQDLYGVYGLLNAFRLHSIHGNRPPPPFRGSD